MPNWSSFLLKGNGPLARLNDVVSFLRPAVQLSKDSSHESVLRFGKLFADTHPNFRDKLVLLNAGPPWGYDEGKWFHLLTGPPAFTTEEVEPFRAVEPLIEKFQCENDLEQWESNTRLVTWLKRERGEAEESSRYPELSFSGTAAWSPPMELLELLSATFPDFQFTLCATTEHYSYEKWTCKGGVLRLVEEEEQVIREEREVGAVYVRNGVVLDPPERIDYREEEGLVPSHDAPFLLPEKPSARRKEHSREKVTNSRQSAEPQSDGHDTCQHEWVVFSRHWYYRDGLPVQCVKCGILGKLCKPTDDEWRGASFGPYRSVRIKDSSRVTIQGQETPS
jgi:hypothetical protein